MSDDAGFGLIELVLAMVVLTIALFALVAALTAGALALKRASNVSTSTALANSQLELYRASTWEDIRLNTDLVNATDSTYRTEASWSSQITDNACSSVLPACMPSRSAVAADGKTYRVDTYITWLTPSGGGRDVKRVLVIVRNPAASNATLIRQASTFEQATG
jgi:Tfp pilus assembly protein PilV